MYMLHCMYLMMETVIHCHDTEILLKVMLNTITPNPLETVWGQCKYSCIIFNIYYSSEEHKLKVFNIIDIKDIFCLQRKLLLMYFSAIQFLLRKTTYKYKDKVLIFFNMCIYMFILIFI